MIIESVDIKYYCYNSFSSNSIDGVVHIKSLPYLSIVQSKTGSYGINLDDGKDFYTGDGNFFIAPSINVQTITHFLNKDKNVFTARYMFLDVLINKKYKLDDVFDIPLILSDEQNSALDKLFDTYEASEHICDKMQCIYIIIKYLMDISVEKSKHRNKDIYPLIEYIRTNYSKEISVQTMANVLKMSESNLFTTFKKSTGMSPIKFINNYRLSIASDLLLQTDESVKSIAEQVGINDQFYFSKLFKAKYSVSPQKYRNIKLY